MLAGIKVRGDFEADLETSLYVTPNDLENWTVKQAEVSKSGSGGLQLTQQRLTIIQVSNHCRSRMSDVFDRGTIQRLTESARETKGDIQD